MDFELLKAILFILNRKQFHRKSRCLFYFKCVKPFNFAYFSAKMQLREI
jgi:hypothetical protein